MRRSEGDVEVLAVVLSPWRAQTNAWSPTHHLHC